MSKILALLLAALACTTLCAQVPQGAPKPPPDKPDGEHKGGQHGPGGPVHRGSGGPGGFGMPGGWDTLSEADREKLRNAIDVAWKSPEMQPAKDKLMKANEEFRAALRATVAKSDPEAAKLLEKVQPPMPFGFRTGGGPPPLKPEDPEFASKALARLGFEQLALVSPEKRDAMRRMHEHLLQQPAVKEAAEKLKTAPVNERFESLKALREVYQREFRNQISEWRKRQEEPKK